MRIALGRRQLVVSLVESCRDWASQYPMAVDASDSELARLNPVRTAALERARTEATALMYGVVRLRSA
jgi:hypothetical protein